jgi:hypothetical protein
LSANFAATNKPRPGFTNALANAIAAAPAMTVALQYRHAMGMPAVALAWLLFHWAIALALEVVLLLILALVLALILALLLKVAFLIW